MRILGALSLCFGYSEVCDETALEGRAARVGLLRVEARPPSIKESGRPRPEYAGRGAYLAGRRSIVTVEILPVKGNGDL